MANPHRICSIPDCCNSASWRDGGKYGLCRKHAYRKRVNGDPLIKRTAANGELAEWIARHVGFDGDDCLIWPYGRCNGYPGRASVDGVVDYAHRHMCRMAHGEAPSSVHEAAHNCGKGRDGCINPGHLRWATPLENTSDKAHHGTVLMGEGITTSKLTEDDVRAIRRMGGKMMHQEIADIIGTTRSNVGAILNRKSWKHLP